MKILIMGFTKIKYMPYMNFYLENIDCKANEVHFLYWNRDEQAEDTSFLEGVTLHEFCRKQDDDVARLSKVGSFIRYRKYARRIIKKGNFDFIIVLHSLTGVLIYDTLCKKYKNKFIFDYRDSTYERFAPFKNIVGKLVKASSATFVSSDAFRCFLPSECEEKIFTSHNLLVDSLSHREEKQIHGIESEKIRIAFWGFIRHEEINRMLIERIAKDLRFELHYYGREQQVALNLKQYAKEIHAANVFFHGEYKPEDRYRFVRSTDLIHNIYDDANMMLAMGNKYYDGAIFKIPLLCAQGSFMAEKATESGIGFECNPMDTDFTDKIYDYYASIDKTLFEHSCDLELQRVLCEYEAGRDLIHSCLRYDKK